MTLFANILQNPQDPRARSDVKLMNQVVNFLSLLAVTEEQGGVKRMLGVCKEFERIARIVLERGDKKDHKRRGSKMNTDTQPPNMPSSDPTQQPPSQNPAPHGQKRAGPALSPESNHTNAPTPQNIFSPSAFNDLTTPQPYNFSPSLSTMNIPLDFGASPPPGAGGAATPDYQTMLSSPPPQNGLNSTNFDPSSQYSPDGLNIGSFQQPFVPQDLWQMPMTLEWDWSEAMQGPPMGVDAMDMGMGTGMGLAPGQGQGQEEQQQGQGQQQMEGGGWV